jgi:DNA ligase-1
MMYVKYLLIISTLFFNYVVAALPNVQLASRYDNEKHNNITHYLVSEKYDGVRAIWNGKQLVTRNGHIINAPKWFTAPLPNIWLDGELWIKPQTFSVLSGIVRTKTPNDTNWRKIRYKIFDMPNTNKPFESRYNDYYTLIKKLNVSHIQAVEQHRFNTHAELTLFFDRVIKQGGEGVMLHLAQAKHTNGRTGALLKLKPYFDAEAVVIGYSAGKGKYTGMLGALRVKTPQGVTFSIGSGFSDQVRSNPPPIGATITYRYYGFTKHGLPRFASFMRIRRVD